MEMLKLGKSIKVYRMVDADEQAMRKLAAGMTEVLPSPFYSMLAWAI